MKGCFSRIGFVVVMIGVIIFGVIFAVSVATQGFDDTLSDFLNWPRDTFCNATGLCEVSNKTELLDEEIIWTRITERTLLDLGKFERNGDWRAEKNVLFVTNSKRMRGTVNITMGMNLGFITEEDVIVDQTNRTITIAIPPIQEVECFVTDEEFYDSFCIEVCDDLERDLKKIAIERSLKADEFQVAKSEAYELAKTEIATLIDIGNLSDETYTVQFIEKDEDPPEIPGATCPAP